jgi:hypothetical protein
MRPNVYDRQRAGNLVPLLRSITTEMLERSRAIQELEARLDRTPRTTDRSACADIDRELSVQRRDLRLAKRELERLGCVLDEDHPLRVLIPGTDGELDHGYAWSPLDERIEALAH